MWLKESGHLCSVFTRLLLFLNAICLRLVIPFAVGGFDMWYQQAGSPLVDKFLKLGGKVCANPTEARKGEI